eukprot:Pgem_evm1s19403
MEEININDNNNVNNDKVSSSGSEDNCVVMDNSPKYETETKGGKSETSLVTDDASVEKGDFKNDSTDEFGTEEFEGEDVQKEKLPFKEMFKKKMSLKHLSAEDKKLLYWTAALNGFFVVLYLVLLILGIAGDYSQTTPLIEDNRIVIGLLFMVLCFIFSTAQSGIWLIEKFYMIIPGLFLCYFLPGLLASFDVFKRKNSLQAVASHYCLPAILCLLCLNVDIKGILRLGPRAIAAFLVGTAGVVFGGPLAVAIMSAAWPATMAPYPNPLFNASNPDQGQPEYCEPWRGLTYVTGSWIGGGANAVAMKDIFKPCQQDLSQAIALDVICGNLWTACLFFAIGKRKFFNKLLRADPRPVNQLKKKMEDYEESIARVPTSLDFIYIACLSMIACGFANGMAYVLALAFGKTNSSFVSYIAFDSMTLWRVMIATILGFALSFTPLKNLEGAGASKIAGVMLYFLVLTIGMGMDITAIVKNPGIFVLGLIWILVHAGCLILVCWLMKAPLFFLAVGSQANIGGAASAPVVASQFAPCLAPVGALFAIFGYVIGTFAAWASSLMIQAAAPNLP